MLHFVLVALIAESLSQQDSEGLSLVQKRAKFTTTGSINSALAVKEDYSCKVPENWTSTWKHQQSEPKKPNLCDEGKLLPELYVIGAQKASTTSFMIDAVQGAGLGCHNDFWGKKYNELSNDMDDTKIAELKASWLESLPACPSQGRQILGDFTSTYLTKGEIPRALRKMYKDEDLDRLTIVVMLREPLARTQAHWYMTKAEDRNATFQEDVEGLLNNTATDQMKDIMMHTRVAANLDQWLKIFPAANFVIVPFLAYSHQGGPQTCGMLTERLAMNGIHCEFGAPWAPRAFPWNPRPRVDEKHDEPEHPKLEDDIEEDVIDKFHMYMQDDMQTLVKQLVEGNKFGMKLLRYEGAPGNEKAIKTWLNKWWH